MKKLCVLLFAILCVAHIHGQSFSDKFTDYQKHIYISSGDSLRYRLLLPEGYDKSQKYPLVLFLHGMGEWGDDNCKQLTHGGQMFLDPVLREQHPAIILIPQTEVNKPWIEKQWRSIDNGIDWGFSSNPKQTRAMSMATELVMQTIVDLPVDKDCVYVMGLSMGGMGTFDIVCRNPQLFAAAISICGGVHPSRLDKSICSVKFRLYHGDNDNIVSCEYSRQAYRQLRDIGASVEYFEFKGVDHASWYMAFNQSDFMEWLFSQKR